MIFLFFPVASDDVVWGKYAPVGRGRSIRRPRHPVRQWSHQVLSDVCRADRKGRRLCPDDVQTVQARLLLVLPGQLGCEYFSPEKHVWNDISDTKIFFSLSRTTSSCVTTTRVPARTNSATRAPRSCGTGPRSSESLPASASCCWWHLRCSCWRRPVSCAASVASAAVRPNSKRRKWTTTTRRWPCNRRPWRHHRRRQPVRVGDSGLSWVGGFFERGLTLIGRRIGRVDGNSLRGTHSND